MHAWPCFLYGHERHLALLHKHTHEGHDLNSRCLFQLNMTVKEKDFYKILRSIKEQLQMRKRRDLTILGRIQNVKPFVIPIFMYRASFISMQKARTKRYRDGGQQIIS